MRIRPALPLLLLALTACPGPVTIVVSPAAVELTVGGSQKFVATVGGGTADERVNWSVLEGALGGSITVDGVYTAPNQPGSFTVVATSVVDKTKSANAHVTVLQTQNNGVQVTVSPASTSVAPLGTRQFTATVTGSTNTAVTWSLPGGGGSITTGGLF